MIIIIITNDNLFNLTEFAHLAPKVLIESIEVILQLACVHLVLRVVSRVLVEVGEENRLAVGRLDMLSRTAVAVPACTDLIVEGTVDFVGFSAENAGEVVRHVEGGGGFAGVLEWWVLRVGKVSQSVLLRSRYMRSAVWYGSV